MNSMSVDGVIMFRQYDRDADGVLSMEEFEPLAHRLLEINVSVCICVHCGIILQTNSASFNICQERYPCTEPVTYDTCIIR